MAVIITTEKITNQNLLNIRTEINRLRVKHLLASISFPTIPEMVRAEEFTAARTEAENLNQSRWISSVNVATLAHVAKDVIIRHTDFSAFRDVLATVDAICAHNADLSNWSDWSDRSDRSDRGDLGVCNDLSNRSDNTIDVFWPGCSFNSSFAGGCGGDCFHGGAQ